MENDLHFDLCSNINTIKDLEQFRQFISSNVFFKNPML
jgi:hypothetical protein